MFSSKSTSEQQQQKEQLTKLLRAADEFFRYNRFDEALVQIDLALNIDPKNVLARSFKERVRMMQKRLHGSAGADKPAAMVEEEKQAAIAKLLAAADEMIRANDYKSAFNRVSEVYKIDPQNFYAKAYSDRIEMLQQQQKTEAEKFFAKPGAPAAPGQPAAGPAPVHGAFFMYRELMKEVWLDGKVTPEEEQELKRVRDIFNISNKEHFEIENEVKRAAYVDALRLAWRDGVLTSTERQVLEMMRLRYDITTDEHVTLEDKVQEAKKGMPTRATVLLVDGDKDHRTSLFGFLKQRHYDVISVGTVEEAFDRIVNQFPHLVLTEIVFSANQMDGFALFEKLRQHQTLRTVPFFFMSRFRDEKVVRAALRLGLDLFFTKPVDQELLIAAIEGRLKRHGA